MASQAALLNATELRQACPDGMFMTTVGDCQGKKFNFIYSSYAYFLFFSLRRQMSHLL